jgi:hypothetical protein
MQCLTEARLLRTLGRDRFCVMMCDTLAVLCIRCEVASPNVFSALCKASAFHPLDVCVKLGEYDVSKGEFKDCEMLLVGRIKESREATKYRRVCI